MNIAARFLPLLIVVIAIPVAIILLVNDSPEVRAGLTQYVFIALFLFPAIVAYVIILVVAFHPPAYHFVPLATDQPAAMDPTIHQAVGLMIALLQDLSRGQIVEERFYKLELLQMLHYEMQQYQIYFDRGYRFIFQFDNDSHYEAHLVQEVGDDDVIIEIDGLFDYYFERNGEQHRTPHGYDTSEPLLRCPARVRCRLQRLNRTAPWQLAGFSENIRGGQLGLATQ